MKHAISYISDTNRLTGKERLLRFLIASIAVLIFISIYLWNPYAHPLTVCKFHQLTGISCPTCGMSRSVQAAAHLHLFESLKFHGAGWIVLAGLTFLLAWALAEAFLGKKLRIPLSSRNKRLIFQGIISLWIFSWLINIARDLNIF